MIATPRLLQLVEAAEAEAVWHLGDIGYADDSFAHSPGAFGYEDAYNGFMRWLEPISSSVPYMVAVGNHESECHSPACIANLERWATPSSKPLDSLRLPP